MTDLEDSQILALFEARSEQAVEELEKKYGALLRRTAGNILSDRQDVEECVNDALLGAWNSIPPARPAPLVSYVCKIARNQALKRWQADTAQKRGGYALVLDELAECLPAESDVEGEYMAKELSAAISRFLDTLDYFDRFCFVRRYWYADSVRDIAAQTRRRSHYISVRLSRTREKLRQTLQKEGLLT